MDDTIYRQAAIDAVMEFMPSLTTPDGCGQFDAEIYAAQEMFADIGQALSDLPSAQPERKKGKWIPQEMNKSYGRISTAVYYYPKCSVCGWSADNTNFCPNCGADMRGGQNE